MILQRAFWIRIVATVIGFSVLSLPAWAGEPNPQTDNRAAVVNGAIVTRGEWNDEVLRIQRTILAMGRPLTCAQVSAVHREVIESLIRRELLYQESRKTGVRIAAKAVDQEIDSLKKRFLSEAEYREELGRRNLSEETLRANLDRNLAVQEYVDRQFGAKVEVKDSELIAYYENNLSLFKQPLQVRVSHLLVRSDPAWEAPRREEARRKAQQMLKDLRQGKDFSTLARELSDGPTRANGGDLGYIRLGQLEKKFEEVVFALKAGETSDLVETDNGFHLFKVLDRKPESILAYDAVKEQIRQSLRQEKAKQEADQYARGLREKAAVEVLISEDGGPAKQP